MKHTCHPWIITCIGCFLILSVDIKSHAEHAVNHGLYRELLAAHVKDGRVDYRTFKKEEKKLDTYLQLLDETNPDTLSRNEQYAFYINAYNAYTIKLILKHYPGIHSIKDIGSWWSSPWKIKFCKIGGKAYTLDEIEHTILRPRFNDPRVHFAINCASMGCPPLIPEPYRGSILDQQLDTSTRAFLNDSRWNRLEGNTLYVSKIFKWFKDDFEGDIVNFFSKYLQEDMRKLFLANREQISVEYLNYDWSLNESS